MAAHQAHRLGCRWCSRMGCLGWFGWTGCSRVAFRSSGLGRAGAVRSHCEAVGFRCCCRRLRRCGSQIVTARCCRYCCLAAWSEHPSNKLDTKICWQTVARAAAGPRSSQPAAVATAAWLPGKSTTASSSIQKTLLAGRCGMMTAVTAAHMPGTTIATPASAS